MDALWAREAPVACLHPGWEPLFGREAVVGSWRRILLEGGAPPEIRCERPSAHVAGETAWVLCAEVVPEASWRDQPLRPGEGGVAHGAPSRSRFSAARRPAGFRN